MGTIAVDVEALKRRVRDEVERHAESVIGLSQAAMSTPELGYAEHRTAEHVTRWLSSHDLPHRSGLAVTGVKAVQAGRAPGPTVGLLGELDGVRVPDHPLADPETGAAPACGHHAQLASAAGAYLALRSVLPQLDGSVAFVAMPAEELLAPGRLEQLRTAGAVELGTGKAELLRLGELDDLDLALLVHTGREGGPRFSVGDTLNGARWLRGRFCGVAAHAGASPWLGVDAARAARLAATAVEAQRETFADTDAVTVQLALSQPEASPGAVPDAAVLDVWVRARTDAGLDDATDKITRALRSGALALGAGLSVTASSTYLPLRSSAGLDDVVETNAHAVVGSDGTARGRHLGACTDMGDLGRVLPVSHAYASGALGSHHTADYLVSDHHRAAVEPAAYLATTVVDLLVDGARRAREVVDGTEGLMTSTDYVRHRRRLETSRRFDPDGVEQ